MAKQKTSRVLKFSVPIVGMRFVGFQSPEKKENKNETVYLTKLVHLQNEKLESYVHEIARLKIENFSQNNLNCGDALQIRNRLRIQLERILDWL